LPPRPRWRDPSDRASAHPGVMDESLTAVERGPKGTAHRIWSAYRGELRGWPPAAGDSGVVRMPVGQIADHVAARGMVVDRVGGVRIRRGAGLWGLGDVV
jgi:hypothetical protein